MALMNEVEVRKDISDLKTFWYQRNRKMQDWYEMLVLVDILVSKGMESYVSNEPQTFYNMAHYLLTKGDLSHVAPIETESALELDRRAKINRGCQYMWSMIDRERQLGGAMPYVDELSFFLLVLGWYSTVLAFDPNTGLLKSQIWNPYDVYPKYANNRLAACVHSYKITTEEARMKAEENRWEYRATSTPTGEVVLDDYFHYGDGSLHNIIFIDNKPVTGWVDRPEMKVLVAPVGGFPDKGSLILKNQARGVRDWKRLAGRSIFEVNGAVTTSFNKWKTMISQILRDTAQPIMQEFSASPVATPQQLRERGAFFHYSPNDQGLQRVPPAAIPIELQANLLELRREMQKGSFNDAVYGMVEGQPGYALSLLATSSANQILYPYMDAKHFVIGEADRFWLSNLKSSKRVFEIKGKLIEKLKPTDIPEEVSVIVESNVATPKDWLERGTIANMVKEHLDEATIITEIMGLQDPQAIKRRKALDRMTGHPVSQMIELASSFETHADYLEFRGDMRQAERFRKAAAALDAQIGAPAPGQGQPVEATQIAAERAAGTPEEIARVAPSIAPPEARGGFTPAQLRKSIGQGKIRVSR